MKQKKTWAVQDNAYFLQDVSTNVDTLDPAIYSVEVTPLGQLYLARKEDQFTFDFKVYALEEDFMTRVLRSYKHTKGNMGVLCNGIRGTGKTITAEILANRLQQPIILIHTAFKGINSFMSAIHQDLTLLIDEYEKVYGGNIDDDDYDRNPEQGSKDADSTLLSLMSGTLSGKYRRMFILTTNRLYINENLLNRPGRIRYKKEFRDLAREQIMEIMDDLLHDKKYTEEIIAFMKPLELITVDIVKSIISEVNIHDESPTVCCKDFNVAFKEDKYYIATVPTKEEEKEEVLAEDIPVRYIESFMTNARQRWSNARIEWGNSYLKCIAAPTSTGIYHVEDIYGDGKKYKVRIVKQKSYHSSLAY